MNEYRARYRSVADKSVGDIVNELLTAKGRDGLSYRYICTLRMHLNRFAAAFHTNISSVTTGMIDQWLGTLALGPRGRNNVRQAVVTLFHFARSRHYLPKGQPTEADDVSRAKDPGGKIGILSPKQLSMLMKKAPAGHWLYFALGAFTGMRSSEILRLEWKDVNFERGHITAAREKTKTPTRRLIRIQPNLMEWLAPYRNRLGPLFHSRRDVDRAIAFAKSRKVEWPGNALRHS